MEEPPLQMQSQVPTSMPSIQRTTDHPERPRRGVFSKWACHHVDDPPSMAEPLSSSFAPPEQQASPRTMQLNDLKELQMQGRVSAGLQAMQRTSPEQDGSKSSMFSPEKTSERTQDDVSSELRQLQMQGRVSAGLQAMQRTVTQQISPETSARLGARDRSKSSASSHDSELSGSPRTRAQLKHLQGKVLAGLSAMRSGRVTTLDFERVPSQSDPSSEEQAPEKVRSVGPQPTVAGGTTDFERVPSQSDPSSEEQVPPESRNPLQSPPSSGSFEAEEEGPKRSVPLVPPMPPSMVATRRTPSRSSGGSREETRMEVPAGAAQSPPLVSASAMPRNSRSSTGSLEDERMQGANFSPPMAPARPRRNLDASLPKPLAMQAPRTGVPPSVPAAVPTRPRNLDASLPPVQVDGQVPHRTEGAGPHSRNVDIQAMLRSISPAAPSRSAPHLTSDVTSPRMPESPVMTRSISPAAPSRSAPHFTSDVTSPPASLAASTARMPASPPAVHPTEPLRTLSPTAPGTPHCEQVPVRNMPHMAPSSPQRLGMNPISLDSPRCVDMAPMLRPLPSSPTLMAPKAMPRTAVPPPPVSKATEGIFGRAQDRVPPGTSRDSESESHSPVPRTDAFVAKAEVRPRPSTGGLDPAISPTLSPLHKSPPAVEAQSRGMMPEKCSIS